MFWCNRFIPKCIDTVVSLYVDCGNDLWIWLWLSDNYNSNEHRHVIAIFNRIGISFQNTRESLTPISPAHNFIQIANKISQLISLKKKMIDDLHAEMVGEMAQESSFC
jgi:hypothetical protein